MKSNQSYRFSFCNYRTFWSCFNLKLVNIVQQPNIRRWRLLIRFFVSSLMERIIISLSEELYSVLCEDYCVIFNTWEGEYYGFIKWIFHGVLMIIKVDITHGRRHSNTLNVDQTDGRGRSWYKMLTSSLRTCVCINRWMDDFRLEIN